MHAVYSGYAHNEDGLNILELEEEENRESVSKV